MFALIRKLANRLSTHGLGYFTLLARNEMTQPRYAITRGIRSAIIPFMGMARGASGTADAWAGKNLQFVYDFSTSAITYDFASYLAAAEVERRLRHLEGITVIFVMATGSGLREETAAYEKAVDLEARKWRIRQMLLPILSLLPTVRAFAICETHEQAATLISNDSDMMYPPDYRLFLPCQPDKRVIHEHARSGIPIWPMFSATAQSRRHIADFLAREAKGRRPIVITLRNYEHAPERNSRHGDWLAFANSLDRAVYAPIFVPDAETVMRAAPVDLSGHIVCEAASLNLEIRMALYEAAWLNMALMHGPTELCWYNEKVRYLLFIEVGTGQIQSEANLVHNGHRIGADLDFAKPYQHIAWQADEISAIKREFEVMRAALERLDAVR